MRRRRDCDIVKDPAKLLAATSSASTMEQSKLSALAKIHAVPDEIRPFRILPEILRLVHFLATVEMLR